MTDEEPLFHLALPGDWRAAVTRGGPYALSTRGVALEAAGFVHLSFRHQVARVAARFYADVPDLLVLTIAPDAVAGEVRVEDLVGGDELFPHLYGPLPLAAITDVQPLEEWLQADRRR